MISFFQLVAHEIGHVLGMWHPEAGWRSNSCPQSGLMGKWAKAERWGKCAQLDFKSMYNYIKNDPRKEGLDWCLTSDFIGFNGKGKAQSSNISFNRKE